MEFDDVADWIHKLSRKYYITSGLFDQWAGIPLEQALQKKGLKQLKSEHFTKHKSSEIYKNFKDMMWDKKLVLFDYPIPDGKEHCDYISELMELQQTKHSKYIITVEAPNMKGKHDDMSDALVRMVWLASQNLGNSSYISKGNKRGGSSPKGKHISMASKLRRTGSHSSRQVPRKGRK